MSPTSQDSEPAQPPSPGQPEPKQPSLAALISANFKVLAGVGILIAAAWGLWFLISKLFPEVPWLQSGT